MTPCRLVHGYRNSEDLIACIFMFEGLSVRQDTCMTLRFCGTKKYWALYTSEVGLHLISQIRCFLLEVRYGIA